MASTHSIKNLFKLSRFADYEIKTVHHVIFWSIYFIFNTLRWGSYYEDYALSIKEVKNCKVSCGLNYKVSSGRELEKQACESGCDLKAPYILKNCEDTYTTLKGDASKSCSDLTTDKCAGGKILGGEQHKPFLNDANNADKNNITLLNGCCSCGGGYGGKPKSYVGGSNDKISKCSEITHSEADTKSNMINACNNATFNINMDSNTLQHDYVKLTQANDILKKISTEIFSKIKNFQKDRKNIEYSTQQQEDNLGYELDRYSILQTTYNNLKEKNANELTTLNGQLENVQLNNDGYHLRYLLWLSIASILFYITLQKLKR